MKYNKQKYKIIGFSLLNAKCKKVQLLQILSFWFQVQQMWFDVFWDNNGGLLEY